MTPNPQPGDADLDADEIDRRQRAWCRFRLRCLSAVADAPSLDCRSCRAYEQSAMDRETFTAELATLAAFGKVIHRLSRTPAKDLPPLMQPRRRRAA